MKYIKLTHPLLFVWAIFAINHFLEIDKNMKWYYCPLFLTEIAVIGTSFFLWSEDIYIYLNKRDDK